MKHRPYYRFLPFIFQLFLLPAGLAAQVQEPYPPIHHGGFSGGKIPQSPDPLVNYRWYNPSAGDTLQIYRLQPALVKAPATFAVPPANSRAAEGITVTGPGDICFDFGVETAGWLEFDSDDLADTVEMSISEYNEPAVVNEGAQHPRKTAVPHRYGHTYRLELNDQLYEGVRFGWIQVRQFTRPWHIRQVRLVCQVHPVNYNGSFWCNDTLLTRIWYTGAYTVRLNLLHDYFGAILMERSDRESWTGDAYPAQAASLVAFGNYDMVKSNLVFTGSRQNNGIPSYSLYWVLSLIDYLRYSGDSALFNALLKNADRRLSEAWTNYDSLSLMGYMGWDERLGAGFENPQTAEAINTYQMLCIKTWSRFAEAVRLAGNSASQSLARKYEDYAAEKSRLLSPGRIKAFNVHALAEAIDGGMIDKQIWTPYASRIFADRNNRLSYSPFNQYFILQAMAKAGFYDEALQTIDDCWGGQIRYGGTSFFEVYRPSWNDFLKTNDAPPNNQCGYTSLAHPWAAGVTQWLSTEVLGIKPVEPGFRVFSVIPHLGNKLSAVRGELPTPYGPVKASYDLVTGNCSFHIPPGTRASRIGIPHAQRRIKTIRLNGKIIFPANGRKKSALMGDDAFVYLRDLTAGDYRVRVSYEKAAPLPDPQKPGWQFPIAVFSEDSSSSGDWQKHYGKKGYVFFGFDDENHRRLPEYVRSVNMPNSATVIWDSLAADGRAISLSLPRQARGIVTRDPAPTWQTMIIDITVTDSLQHDYSLYFVDYDRRQRRAAMEIFNLENLNLAAPVRLISHYDQGKYIRFSARGSLRIRINQVRGVNAAVSGLFFD